MTDIRDRDRLATGEARDLALSCVEAGIDAAHPERVVHDAVEVRDGRLGVQDATYDLYPYRRIVVLGGGNAAAHVAAALEDEIGDRLDGGVVVTDDPVDLASVEVLPGAHPVPSEAGVESTRALLDRATEVGGDALVLAVVTGGGSALMAAPAAGLSLEDLRATTDGLLRSGASIHEINAVRKHCSAGKGGHLAAALAPATVVTLVFSDVVGNDLDVIASGPTVPDTSTFEDALAVLDRYDVEVPTSVRDRLEAGAAGSIEETPSPGDPAFDRVSTHVLADGTTALTAAADAAAAAGYDPVILSSRFEGEAREAAAFHDAVVAEVDATGNPASPPTVLLSGGETTVAVTGDGAGGPNQEFALSAALSLPGDAVVASVDTDGIDGASDAAGAILDADTIDDGDRARAALDDHDVTPYLADRDALVVTGQTGTNVNDLRVFVVPG
ncbi:MAG: glycerate kinase [Halanaeroarchaeum sp.]